MCLAYRKKVIVGFCCFTYCDDSQLQSCVNKLYVHFLALAHRSSRCGAAHKFWSLPHHHLLLGKIVTHSATKICTVHLGALVNEAWQCWKCARINWALIDLAVKGVSHCMA